MTKSDQSAKNRKSGGEQKVTRQTLRRELQERLFHQMRRGDKKSFAEIEFLTSTLADDEIRECQSAEDEAAREATAGYFLSLVPNDGTQQLTGGAPSNPPDSPPPSLSGTASTNPRLGGYDGGLSIGWEGTWNPGQFKRLTAALEAAKERAMNVRSGEFDPINLGGVDAVVDPCGGKIGNNVWRYKFHAFGITFLVHHNPSNTQQVRATYGAEALMQNTLPALHSKVLAFLTSLGFHITKETLTRVDMQVMVDIPLMNFIDLIFRRHAVKKARKSAIYFLSDIPKTYRIGDIDNVQVCIYDKRAEMKRMKLEKKKLTIEHSIGQEWWESKRPITRVEFRLGRNALRCFGVDSVADLLERERGILDLVSHDWFRLLEKPKVPGRGKRAKTHPLWDRVRSLFFEHFTGSKIRDIQYRKPQPISCDPTPLLRQAAGCIAKAVAIQNGKQDTSENIVRLVSGWSCRSKAEIFRKVNLHADTMEITKGIRCGIDKAVLEQSRSRVTEGFHFPPADNPRQNTDNEEGSDFMTNQADLE